MTTIYSKLLEAQKEIGAVKKDSDNPFFHSKYVDINGILGVVKPVLNKHCLVLIQALNVMEGRTGLTTMIIDSESGDKIESNVFLPETNKVQETGSAITYFRRYALQSLLALEAEDDDGNATSNGKKPKVLDIPKSTALPPSNVNKFMQDLEPTDEEVILSQKKLESARTLIQLKSFWEITPPGIKEKLEDVKEELKKKLK